MRLCCNGLSLAALTLRLMHVHSATDLGWQTAPLMPAGRRRLPVKSAMNPHKPWLMLPTGAEDQARLELMHGTVFMLHLYTQHLGLPACTEQLNIPEVLKGQLPGWRCGAHKGGPHDVREQVMDSVQGAQRALSYAHDSVPILPCLSFFPCVKMGYISNNL